MVCTDYGSGHPQKGSLVVSPHPLSRDPVTVFVFRVSRLQRVWGWGRVSCPQLQTRPEEELVQRSRTGVGGVRHYGGSSPSPTGTVLPLGRPGPADGSGELYFPLEQDRVCPE